MKQKTKRKISWHVTRYMSLLGNILAGKRVIRAGEGVIRAGEGSIATSQR